MVLGILTLHNSHWTTLLMQAKMAGRLTWCTFIFHLIVSYRSHILTSTNYWNFIKLPKFWFTNIDFTHLLPIYDYFFTFSLDFTTFSTCVPKNTKTIFWQTCRWVWYINARNDALQECINFKEFWKCLCAIFWAFCKCPTSGNTQMNSSPISGRCRVWISAEVS